MHDADQALRDPNDPVHAPDAYRASLLAALGDDDPAFAQAQTVDALRALVASARDVLHIRPSDGGWSALECLGHLVDSELMASVRSRWILAEDEPDLVGYDQESWVARLHHAQDDPDALLELFGALRRVSLDLWARTPPADRARVGRHRERGPESYDLIFRLAAGHDRVHLEQARAAVDAARRLRSEAAVPA